MVAEIAGRKVEAPEGTVDAFYVLDDIRKKLEKRMGTLRITARPRFGNPTYYDLKKPSRPWGILSKLILETESRFNPNEEIRMIIHDPLIQKDIVETLEKYTKTLECTTGILTPIRLYLA